MSVEETKVTPPAARRSERVFLRIPIEVEGTSAENKPFRETAFTLVINRDGARIALKNALRGGERITIKNLKTGTSAAFRVVGPVGRSLGEGPEWGVECLEPDKNFWGINFPAKAATSIEGRVDALLECTACGFRELDELTLEEYRQLASVGSLARDCPRCHAVRNWKVGSAEAGAVEMPTKGPTAPRASADSTKSRERRSAKRMTVKLPVRVRLADGREEMTRTENLSKTGVCFVSDLAAEPGESIRLTVGYEPGGAAQEITARVVWRRPFEGTSHFIYGVHLEEPA